MRIKAPRIQSLSDLRHALQAAIELEHATIPPYLCALYSLKKGANQEIAQLIGSVVIEEMQHMSLVCNILNAVGFSPQINKLGFVPSYPGPLPMGIGDEHDHPFIVHLKRFSLELVKDTFMVIEEPEQAINIHSFAAEEMPYYHTIGEFYQGIKHMIIELGPRIFTGDPARQITTWYGSNDGLIKVTSVETAIEAINRIVSEGEGSSRSPLDQARDLAHYYKFAEIYEGKHLIADPADPKGWNYCGSPIPFDPAMIYLMIDDPTSNGLPMGSHARLLSTQFNRTYSYLLNALHQTFNGTPDMLPRAMGLMYSLRVQASELMETPVPDAAFTAGPAFEPAAD